ncbi:hypothetical protein DFQ27_000714 [Actinomortierella ambigua]|uniref:Alpha/beta-hydrolase n=1 Tax=Actinomortierella ambigua TaxID=1343610 RepID=A0A9P6QJ72_9FUNG|nr:hypothetical protein DFQ27_000714 [Actinomortierella ambigua]
MASIPIPRRYRTMIRIPSRHDGTLIEICLSVPTSLPSTPQAFTGVVIAHPYGPLGGSINNNVVGSLLQWFETHTLLDQSDESIAGVSNATKTVSLACVICAVNFRGCGKSGGRTTWTGEAEREDYQTVIDFLQSSAQPASAISSPVEGTSPDGYKNDASTSANKPSFKRIDSVLNEHGSTVDRPRLPFISRFILCGFSYGAMIASSIPPPLRDPTRPESAHLPTTYILVSYPAGVGWFLMTGHQSSYYSRAKAHLSGATAQGEDQVASVNNSSEGIANEVSVGGGKGKGRSEDNAEKRQQPAKAAPPTKAYFITGGQDQFTSPKTLQQWLKNYAGLDSLNSMTLSDRHHQPQQQQQQQQPSSYADRSGEQPQQQQQQQREQLRRKRSKRRYDKPLSPTTSIADRDGARIQLDILQDADHFWIDREDELLMRLEMWWESTHPVTVDSLTL